MLLVSSKATAWAPTAVGTFIVCDEINVITPVGTSVADNGTRHQLIPTSDETLNAL